MKKRMILYLCGVESHFLYAVMCRADRVFRKLEIAVRKGRFAPQSYVELKGQFTVITEHYKQFLDGIAARIPQGADVLTKTQKSTMHSIFLASDKVKITISTVVGIELAELVKSTSRIFSLLALLTGLPADARHELEKINSEFSQYEQHFEAALKILENKI